MSKRICENCKSTNLRKDKYIDDGSDCYICEDCCRVGTADEFPEYTVFHQLTASPEVLAENLLHCIWYPHGRRWISTVIVWEEFEDKKEAYAATVAKLKEVCDE